MYIVAGILVYAYHFNIALSKSHILNIIHTLNVNQRVL